MPLDYRFKKHLRSLASNRTKFKQDQGKQHFDETITRKLVTGGYCRGACLHWLRISLGSDSTAAAISHKDSALVSQMARTQFQFTHLPHVSTLKLEVLRGKMMKWFAPEGPHQKWFAKGAEVQLSELTKWLDSLKCDFSFKIVDRPRDGEEFGGGLGFETNWRPREGADIDAATSLDIERRINSYCEAARKAGEEHVTTQMKSKGDRIVSEAQQGKLIKKLWTSIEPRLSFDGIRYFETMLPVKASSRPSGAKLKRGEDGIGKSLAGISETERKGVGGDFDLIRKDKDEQSKKVLDHCKQIRACLRENNPDEFDEAAVQQFDKSEGQISATGLAELYTWLKA